ncbi:hypothetical protein PtA15_2A227 [Puccinia triticina]|uniref:Uncharacterized protein n=1 Tax=Puccinia triticina TaxID=208348 RepID=A0ABY7C9U0_9BASI|nr:uncharacterized protein PtA15_2A227 [Puccinia triticina]WAQ81914.1 hypothetical protein PtA15_2A227 [Puccinia triticina]
MGSAPIDYRLVFSTFRQDYGPVVFTHYVLAPLASGHCRPARLRLPDRPAHRPAPLHLPLPGYRHDPALPPPQFSPHFLFHHVHSFLHPAADFLLACMGLFFTSSFILIPRRDVMPGKEIGLIAALFLPSLLVTWAATVVLVKALAFVWPQAPVDAPEDNNADVLSSDGGRYSGSQHHEQAEDAGLASAEAGRSAPASTHSAIEIREPPAPPGNPRLALDNTLTLIATEPVDDDKKSLGEDEKAWPERSLAKLKDKLRRQTRPDGPAETREVRLARRPQACFDPAVYLLVLLPGIPLFFAPGGEHRTMPLFTGVVALAWLYPGGTPMTSDGL